MEGIIKKLRNLKLLLRNKLIKKEFNKQKQTFYENVIFLDEDNPYITTNSKDEDQDIIENDSEK